MSTLLSPVEVEAVLKLPAEGRYAYFLRQVVQEGQVWGLVTDQEWALASDGESTCLALWSHETFAAKCALDSWSAATAQALNLDQLKELLTVLAAQQIKVVAFMTPEALGQVVAPEDLQSQLWQQVQSELERY